jgi:predicted RNase H-like HicB family nuclease
MLIDYIQTAMRRAHYEMMENGRFFGSIAECQGAWGEGETLEQCREELQSALEDWLLIRVRHGLPVPTIDGLDINPQPEYAQTD